MCSADDWGFNLLTMPAGRPPMFDNSAQLQEAIDDYFKNIPTKKVVIGTGATKRIEEVPIPTITGLVYHIGFESRTAFYDYEKKDEFKYTIKRARLFIEHEYEQQLNVGNTIGAIFALKNMGWIDKQGIEHTGADGKEIAHKIIIEHIGNNDTP
jgi:hypothetical protein